MTLGVGHASGCQWVVSECEGRGPSFGTERGVSGTRTRTRTRKEGIRIEIRSGHTPTRMVLSEHHRHTKIERKECRMREEEPRRKEGTVGRSIQYDGPLRCSKSMKYKSRAGFAAVHA